MSLKIMKGLTGAELIGAERNRQFRQEGFTAELDDNHTGRELIDAAVCYLNDADTFPAGEGSGWWPFEDRLWKPSVDAPIKNLMKAGALIAAEIDRLLRAQSRQQNSPAEGSAE